MPDRNHSGSRRTAVEIKDFLTAVAESLGHDDCHAVVADAAVEVEKRVNELISEHGAVIEKLSEIGLALTGEIRLEKLLEMIVDEARYLTGADAGTLYTVDESGRNLNFSILHNDSMNVRVGGTSGVEITLPPVPLYTDDGSRNIDHVSAYCALTGKTVNIADVYEAEGFDFTGPRKYDSATGYRSKSMLVMALKNHEKDIIGVLQLLNALDDDGSIVGFSKDIVNIVGSLASQAAIALTSVQLIQGLKDLLYSVIQSIAAAIDAKSPYTNGHIERVVELTSMIAEGINISAEGPFSGVNFSEEEIEELKLAAWMHDVGKISIPEHVVDKSTKLETIFDRGDMVDSRFSLIAEILNNERLEKIIEIMSDDRDNLKISAVEAEYARKFKDLEDDRKFVLSCNIPNEFMTDERIARINSIASRTYHRGGETFNWLTDDEVENLCVRKGTLTDKERKVIESHATITREMLDRLPFPKRFSNVPKFAAAHHEKLDGTGYPEGLSAAELPLQARIMAVADIFEALTAKDRPYKKPMKISQAVEILKFMDRDRHIDHDIVELLIKSGIYMEYARKELDPVQFDDE